MPHSFHLGEFEQLVLLVLLREGAGTSAPVLIEALGNKTPRRPARGAVYRTLDRLIDKGLVESSTETGTASRGGLPRRGFAVAPAGLKALSDSRHLLMELWSGLEEVLDR